MNSPKPNKTKTNRQKAPALPPLRYLSPLHRIQRQLQVHLHQSVAPIGITGTEAHLLSYLASYAPVPVGDLVRVFGLKKSTLTGILDRLEEAGYTIRQINPDDRRSFLLKTTPRGAKAAQKVRALLERFEASLDAELSASDKKAFVRVAAAIERATSPT